MNDEEIQNLRTRCGYKPSECVSAFEKNLTESGGSATGKCLHFGADLICSGGLITLFKILWDYSMNHINIGSVRVFMYLKTRMKEIDDLVKTYPDETLYSREDFQLKIGEIILILHDAPKHPKLTWPKVGSETHDETWLKNATSAPNTEIVNKVWKSDGDMIVLKYVGNELCKCLVDQSFERALFWIKYTFEEEARVKKENSKASLTTVDRGGKHGGAGYYFLNIFAEYYKELAKKNQIRMHEEFQTILDIYKLQDIRINNSFKKNLLGLCVKILCEVPRWKIPAANPLIKDPIVLSRAVSQTPKFFTEVLQYPSVNSTNMNKLLKNKGKAEKKKDVKKLSMEEQFAAFDNAMLLYMNKQ